MRKSRRFLPDHVTRFRDRHGKWRYRYRRVGAPGGYFRAEFGSDEWRAELAAFEANERTPVTTGRRIRAGSIADLLARYRAVPTRIGPTAVTRQKVNAVLDKFDQEHGHRMVDEVEFEHIDAIVAKKAEQTVANGKKHGGIYAARKLRKELVRLFDFAVKVRLRADNPVTHSERIAEPKGNRGFHTWSEDEIERYRARHPLGTRARLAMELMLWTGQRRGDARLFGPAMIVDGRIAVKQGKTGKEGWIVVAPQLVEAITAMPAPPAEATTFLLTERGTTYTAASFGNTFRRWCDQAGLPQCTAHGLRKAIMRRMAELDMGNQTMKSISFHSKDDEVARYTRDANQVKMADAAIGALAAWEKGR